jgi:hypothetical protein
MMRDEEEEEGGRRRRTKNRLFTDKSVARRRKSLSSLSTTFNFELSLQKTTIQRSKLKTAQNSKHIKNQLIIFLITSDQRRPRSQKLD